VWGGGKVRKAIVSVGQNQKTVFLQTGQWTLHILQKIFFFGNKYFFTTIKKNFIFLKKMFVLKIFFQNFKTFSAHKKFMNVFFYFFRKKNFKKKKNTFFQKN